MDKQQYFDFEVQQNDKEDGKVVVLHINETTGLDKVDLDLLYSALSEVCGQNDITHIDISSLRSLTGLDYARLSKDLAKLVFKKECLQVKVSVKHIKILKGQLKGMFYQDLKSSIGDNLTLKTLNTTVNLKDIISSCAFLDKVTTDDLSENILLVINQLNDIESIYSPHPMLVSSVWHAYKYLLKQKRVSNQDKRRVNAMYPQAAEDCMEEYLMENETTHVIEKDENSKEQRCEDTEFSKLLSQKNDKLDKNCSSNATTDSHTGSTTKYSQSCLKEENENIKGKKKVWIKKKTFKCYVCKSCYCFSKKKSKLEGAWQQYPRMCLPCAEFNYIKRNQRVNLDGRYALVTGGRIKIGYELVLKLLRDDCFVIVTTRFPHDATKRFAQESDFDSWSCKLKVYPLDLKDINGINTFVKYVKQTVPHLDIIINNAAQTLRRPIDFYRHLLDYECIPQSHLKEEQQQLLATAKSLSYGYPKQRVTHAIAENMSTSKPTVEELLDDNDQFNGSVILQDSRLQCQDSNDVSDNVNDPDEYEPPLKKSKSQHDFSKKNKSVKFLQRSFSMDAAHTPSHTGNEKYEKQKSVDVASTSSHQSQKYSIDAKSSQKEMFNMAQYFPRGAMDSHGQQLDLRRNNSWRTPIDQVPLAELMEVMMVNTVAPFILNKDLKSLMLKSPSNRKFVVNVSAMEGQFNREAKTKFHPHTNMAKAALNMMTRTAALGYKDKNIYMTSVDTGWVTDERPLHMAKREQRFKGFRLPLDCVDGAARIYDPIVTGLTEEGTPHYAVFIKNYNVYPW